jgi:hypothetical protein
VGPRRGWLGAGVKGKLLPRFHRKQRSLVPRHKWLIIGYLQAKSAGFVWFGPGNSLVSS